MDEQGQDVTRLLVAVQEGDAGARDQLYQAVYGELHRIAARYMRRERPDHTLQATALIHEAYVHLIGHQGRRDWNSRAHFYGVAAGVMRRILIDHARAHRAAKRGGHEQKLPLEDLPVMAPERSDELLALDEALARLAQLEPRQSRIVELRYFAGLTDEETAQVIGVSSRTIKRDWRLARAWLHGELNK